MTLQNNKILLRPSLRKALTQLEPERKEAASLDACFFLIKHLQSSNFKVLSFASTAFEINLWPLNRWLIKKERLLLPKVENNQLQIYEVTDIQNLKLSSQGIQEPCPLHCKRVEIEDCNPLILVPALGFDDTHHRIGRGKGHYDKLLLRFPQSIKWGVGFQEQRCQNLPIEDHDLALDKVLFF
jgi:5-formyltetrahydrofolate cyclo-ligase